MKDNHSKKLTYENGAPVPNATDSLTSGERGPVSMQDFWLIEKMAHFDREVIPERRMHAKGSGAFGTFTVTGDITKYTTAKVFSEIGKQTEVFVRFSTVAGERGAADAERDIRGFATRFYTEEGNYDIVGNNTPVFFIRDGMQFPDLNRAVKRDPKTNMRSAQNNWDFWTMLPEALHQVTIVMSDRGIPKGYRHMHGFGSHTFAMYNKDNERVWIKYHWRCQQGIENLTDQEAEELVGQDRESSQHDLFDAIERGDYPKWKLCIQVMTEEQAHAHKDNPFDITKVWSHKEYPLIEVGEMELNRNPDNYFVDVEQAAFKPTHLVPGIDLSPDKLLQARIFSYGDAQRYRLGVNHNLIPVNMPKVPTHDYHRDGHMRVDDNHGATLGYHPNSYGEWAEQPEFAEPPLPLEGDLARYSQYGPNDNCFYQPGDLYRLMTDEKRDLLIENTVRNFAPVTENIKYRHAAHCYLADKEYGERIAKAAELDMSKVIEIAEIPDVHDRLAATSMEAWGIATRKP